MITAGHQLRNLVTCMWGACAGYLAVLVLLLPVLSTFKAHGSRQHPHMPEIQDFGSATVVPWQQELQKDVYVLRCLVCPLAAWLSLRWRSHLGGWLGLVAVVLFVPVIFAANGSMHAGAPRPTAFVLALVALAGPFLLGGRPTKMFSVRARRSKWATTGSTTSPMAVKSDGGTATSSAGPPSTPWRRTLFMATFIGLIIFFLLPWKPHKFADAFLLESHLSSFLIGPSLSMLRAGAVPGFDFESHYGIGHAYVFSYLLGPTMHTTLTAYLWFLFAVLLVYHLSAYVVLRDLLRSDTTAFVAALVLLAFSMEGLTFAAPSNWPIRFPFLFLFIRCVARAEGLGRSWLAVAWAGCWAGLSLFWQTDIGLYLGMAGLIYYLALSVRERCGVMRAPLFLACASGAFALLALVAFGPRTLSLLFYRRLLDPLLTYGGGFGFVPMRWEPSWSYLYNVIAPTIALGTVGFALKRFTTVGTDKQEARYLFLFATSGLLMLFKWINRASDPVWSINAPAVIAVLFWWTFTLVTALGDYLEARRGTHRFGTCWSMRTVAAGVVFVGLGAIGTIASFFHNPTYFGGYSTSPLVRMKALTCQTPTLANKALNKVGKFPPPANRALPVDPVDIDLIRGHAAANEAVTLLAAHDWIYLAQARRAPAFAWVPIYYTYTFSLLDQAENTLRNSNLVFVDRESLPRLQVSHRVLYDRLSPILNQGFTLAATGKALDMYRRKDQQTAAGGSGCGALPKASLMSGI